MRSQVKKRVGGCSGQGDGVCKGLPQKDLDRCENSWSARLGASKGSLARARLAWEAGSQCQVGGDVILALERAIWAEDTDWVIICRKMIIEVK